MKPSTDNPAPVSLEQLLRRDDIWRGHSHHFSSKPAATTGYNDLNAALLHGGWPLGTLIEICQHRFQGEWQLFIPALRALDSGLIVLLNPPAAPFSQALIQAGVDLDRLVIVNASDKSQFVACFCELARTAGCATVLGWQPRDNPSYTQLRKCLLATGEGSGLYGIFRPAAAQQQSSPASLRLFCQTISEGLEITLFKQKGMLQRQQPRPLVLPLPAAWHEAPPHSALDQGSQAPRSTPHQHSSRGEGSNVVDLRGRR